MDAGEQKSALLKEQGDDAPVVTMPPAYTPAEVAVKGPAVLPPTRSLPVDPSLSTVYLSVFAMLFCCWPCGLVGLIYGIQGMQQYYRGEYDQSTRTEKRAKKWAIASIVTGVVITVTIITVSLLSQAIIYGVVFATRDDSN